MESQNKENKLPSCIGGIKKTGRVKKFRKKKTFWAGILSVGLVTVVAAGFLFRSRATENRAADMTVQSATASTGSISTTVVGTGTLAEGSANDVMVPAGIKVKEVLVESGDTVKEGQELATLDEASIASQLLEVNESIESVEEEISNLSDNAQTAGTTEYLESKVLNGQLEELKEMQTTLDALLESKVITASCAGTITTINVTADTEITKASGCSSGAASGSSTSVSTSGTSSEGTAAESKNTNMITAVSGSQMNMVSLTADITKTETETADSTETEIADSAETDGLAMFTTAQETERDAADNGTGGSKISIESCNVAVSAPVTGEKPQSDIQTTDQYTGNISWNCSTETFLEKTVYTATIKLTAKEGYTFSANILPEINGADVTSEVLTDDEGNSVLRIKAKFAKTAADKDTTESGENKPSDNNNTSGGVSGSDNSQTAGLDGSGSGDAVNSGNSTISGGSSTSGNSSTSGAGQSTASASDTTGNSGGSSSSDSVSASEYSVCEAAAFSISSPDEAVVSINVDELDILSVEKGQTAVITLDALENQEFEGTITKVSASASSGSSSAKYPVEITLEKTADMKLGMSVSATIQIDESEDAVLIPVNALQEKGNSTFVYTGKDEDGNLTDEVEVETGLSNGSQVEIVSGLVNGDTVYYLKAESSDSGFDMSQDMMGGRGQEIPSGEMPSGGMPDSGGQGGPGGSGFSK